MFFALIHEMGHLICGLMLGLKPKSLKIMPIGLSIEFNVICEDYNKKIKKANILEIKKMLIALAGPLTNIFAILIVVVIKKYTNIIVYNEIIYANTLIAIFNLLPIYPLDGGRFIKSFLHIVRGNKVAIEYINIISNLSVIIITMLSSVAIIYYKNIAILFIIVYLWILLIVENKKYNIKRRIYKIIENS